MGRKRTLDYKNQNAQRKRKKREGVANNNLIMNGLNTDNSPYNHQSNIITARAFERTMSSIQFNECLTCKRKQLNLEMATEYECLRCQNYQLNNKFNPYTLENNMDPGDVPSQLKDLNSIEEMLIAKVHPVICMYRYKKGQYIYKHQVINFPQDIVKFSKELPPTLESLSEIILISRNFVHNRTKKLEVNKNRVITALKWLKANNPNYKDVFINESNLPNGTIDLFDYLSIYNEQTADDLTNELNSNATS